MEIVTIDDQVINMLIKRGRNPVWFLSAIYASPKLNFRNELWQYIKSGFMQDIPWLLVGDFNQVLDDSEKRGGKPIAQYRARPFREMVNGCALIDIGFEGLRFTWSNMRRGSALVEESIDRYFCNQLWLNRFPKARVSHLPRILSDHHLVLIQSNGFKSN